MKSRYRHETPLNLRAPLPAGIAGERPVEPVRRPALHEHGCWCQACWNAGLRYADYLHAKKMNDL